MNDTTYVADAPLASREADQLRRWPFASRIADTLAARSDPTSLVIGVYGRWGEGKTTVLHFVEHRLKEEHASTVVVVRFNPWLFTNDTELFVGFFEQVAQAIDEQLETKKGKLGGILRSYGWIVAGLGVDLSKAGEALAKTTAQELRERLESALAKKSKRIVVLLDDIDRLDNSAAQAVFRLLKVAADFRWTSYVLAFDREVVAAALSERYAGRANGGDEFLEKIIQVPLPLPPAPPEVLRKLLLSDLFRVLDDTGIDLSDRDAVRFVHNFDYALLSHVQTPRAAKRYVNAIQFLLPMLRGEVNIVDLLLIEALRIFRPQIHALIQREREIFLGGSEAVSKTDTEAFHAEFTALSGLGSRNRREVNLLEDLFPRVQSIFSNTFVGERAARQWLEHKRIASERYFARYFSSGIPVGDLPDSEIEGLVAAAATTPNDAAASIRGMLEQVEADRLVQKLDAGLDTEAPVALALAEVLLTVGGDFPNPPGVFGDLESPRGRLASLVSRLLRHLPPPRVDALTEKLSQTTLGFALQVFRRLRWAESEGEESAAVRLTESEWKELGSRLSARVAVEAEDSWLFEKDGEDGPYRTILWRDLGDLEALRAYVELRVKNNASRALDVVRYFSTSHHNGSAEVLYESLGTEGYERLKSTFDPSILDVPLRATYGTPPDEYEAPEFVESDADLAHSFLARVSADQDGADVDDGAKEDA